MNENEHVHWPTVNKTTGVNTASIKKRIAVYNRHKNRSFNEALKPWRRNVTTYKNALIAVYEIHAKFHTLIFRSIFLVALNFKCYFLCNTITSW